MFLFSLANLTNQHFSLTFTNLYHTYPVLHVLQRLRSAGQPVLAARDRGRAWADQLEQWRGGGLLLGLR